MVTRGPPGGAPADPVVEVYTTRGAAPWQPRGPDGDPLPAGRANEAQEFFHHWRRGAAAPPCKWASTWRRWPLERGTAQPVAAA